MAILIVGLSHKTAPLATRELVAFRRDLLPIALEQCMQLPAVSEVLILSTCNRVELIASAEQDSAAISSITAFLHRHHGVRLGELDPFLYAYTGKDAVRHLLRVACGLDSMVIGESQILGQIRDAYEAALCLGCLGHSLKRLLFYTFHFSKKVRGETDISAAGWSVSRAAVEWAKDILGDLTNRTVLVVGAGKMSVLTARHLYRSGAKHVLVTNRTFDRAAQLAGQFQGEAVHFEHLGQALVRADIVISSVAASASYVIQQHHVERALSERGDRPITFIDIAVPRNVEPSIATLRNVYVCDIDGLETSISSHVREVASAVEAAEGMVQAAVDAFFQRSDLHDLGPLIHALRNRLHSIGIAELEHHFFRLTNSTAQDREYLQAMVERITNKILHPLVTQLKREASSSASQSGYIKALSIAFNIQT